MRSKVVRRRSASGVPRGNVGVFAFSPDGSQLAAIVNQDLWILTYPSGTPRNLRGATTSVSWFPDSRHVLVSGGNFNNTLSFWTPLTAAAG